MTSRIEARPRPRHGAKRIVAPLAFAIAPVEVVVPLERKGFIGRLFGRRVA